MAVKTRDEALARARYVNDQAKQRLADRNLSEGEIRTYMDLAVYSATVWYTLNHHYIDSMGWCNQCDRRPNSSGECSTVDEIIRSLNDKEASIPND